MYLFSTLVNKLFDSYFSSQGSTHKLFSIEDPNQPSAALLPPAPTQPSAASQPHAAIQSFTVLQPPAVLQPSATHQSSAAPQPSIPPQPSTVQPSSPPAAQQSSSRTAGIDSVVLVAWGFFLRNKTLRNL